MNKPALAYRTLLLVGAVSGLAACDEIVGPRTYEDCVLKNLRGATNNAVVVRVEESCREKFPEKPITQVKTRELAPWELASVTGRAGAATYTNRFAGTLYNGNKEITVTEVQILVKTKEGGKDTTRSYAAHVAVPPLTAKDFSFDIIVGDKGTDYEWSIGSGRGY